MCIVRPKTTIHHDANFIIIGAVSKITKTIYPSDVQATFQLYSHFLCLQVVYSKWNYIYKYCLIQLI